MTIQRLIAPSLLSADFLYLAESLKSLELAGADWIHLDVMDGHFVPNLTFGPAVIQHIKKASTLFLDAHLMVTPIEPFIDMFIKAGVDQITFHPESTPHPHRVLQKIREKGLKAGIALNPGTPLEIALPLLECVDLMMIMTVNPGFSGQTFIEAPLKKLKDLRNIIAKQQLPILLQVDGGMSPETAPKAWAAGAHCLVAGNAIFSDNSSRTSELYRYRMDMLRQS